MFANDTRIDVETALEVNNEFGIISMFKVKKTKNNEQRKMKGMISMLAGTKKEELW